MLTCGKRELVAILFIVSLFSSACLVRRRTVAPVGKPKAQPLLNATRNELIDSLHQLFDPIQSFSLKTDMSPSVGELYGGKVTDYPTISGYILYQKPDNIRVIGLDLVIHSTAFDMVSTGMDFKVSIPSKAQFLTGRNDSPPSGKSKLENLRPAAFLDALMLKPPDPASEIAFLQDDTNQEKAVYILFIVRREGGVIRPVRNIYFDRYTLQVSRQKTFDADGRVLSETKYSNWNTHEKIFFPDLIDIARPKDGYEVQLKAVELKLNTPEVTPAKFILNQPPGSELKALP